MTAKDEIEKLQKLVNSSGFPFQLRIAQEVRGMEHLAWSVIAEEHPWRDSEHRKRRIYRLSNRPKYQQRLASHDHRMQKNTRRGVDLPSAE